MYITDVAFLTCMFWKVKSDALSDQLIAFTSLPIQYRDLPSAALNQTCAFQFLSSNRDRWPLDAQHFGEQILRIQQCVVVTAVTHHEQPTRQPLLEAVRTVARHRHQDLLQKGLNVSGHEPSEGGHRIHRPCKGRPRNLGRAPR
jgi:hypothetical protein